jgi:hypothetical protein
MKRAEILATTTKYVTQDRAATHGYVEDSFAELGRVWGARLGVAIAPHQVSIMLSDLKSVRAWHNLGHADIWVDGAGYFACGGKIATERHS